MRHLLWPLAALTLVAVAACGGAGADDTRDDSHPDVTEPVEELPTADVNEDLPVDEVGVLTLDGLVDGSDVVVYGTVENVERAHFHPQTWDGVDQDDSSAVELRTVASPDQETARYAVRIAEVLRGDPDEEIVIYQVIAYGDEDVSGAPYPEAGEDAIWFLTRMEHSSGYLVAQTQGVVIDRSGSLETGGEDGLAQEIAQFDSTDELVAHLRAE